MIPAFLAILLIGFVVFFPIFFSGFIADDIQQIVHSSYIHNFSSSWDIFTRIIASPSENNFLLGFFYRPLQFAVYAVLYSLFGTNAFVFHLFQWIIYIISVFFLYKFFNLFFKRKIALLLSIIFLIHPANVELGSYIGALADSLCFLFGICALFFIVKTKKTQAKTILISCLFLLLSLFSKETGILFLIISLFYSFYKKTLKIYLVPFSLMFVTYLIFRIHASSHPFMNLLPSPINCLSIIEKTFISIQAAAAIIKEIIMPTREVFQNNFFSLDIIKTLSSIGIILVFWVCFIIFWKICNNINKTQAKLSLFFFSIVIVGILFFAQIIPLEILFAERWLYIGEIGMLGLLGQLLYILPKKAKWLNLFKILFGIIILLYAAHSIYINANFQKLGKHSDSGKNYTVSETFCQKT